MVAALIWGVPGVPITIKGLRAYATLSVSEIWWSVVLTLCIVAFFALIFHRVVNRYTARIATLPEKNYLWQTFPLRGWLLILFMMGLGVAMKHISGIPLQFTAIFYSGLGPMLIAAAARYLKSGFYPAK